MWSCDFMTISLSDPIASPVNEDYLYSQKNVNKKHLLKVCYVLFVGIVDCVPVEVHI